MREPGSNAALQSTATARGSSQLADLMSLVVPFYVHHLEVDYGVLQVPSCTWLALARPCETPGETFHELSWDGQRDSSQRPVTPGINIQVQFKRQGF